jgi:hypothetical protein
MNTIQQQQVFTSNSNDFNITHTTMLTEGTSSMCRARDT